jgi:hypothetical protein
MRPRYLLDSTPSGAEVREGTVVLGTTPLDTEKLTPDVEHKLTVSLAGHDDATVTVKLREGETYRDKVSLKKTRGTSPPPNPRPDPTPPPPPPPSGSGYLTLSTTPWAKVYIDGKYVDSTPIAKVELPAGAHSIRLVNEAAGVDTTKSVKIKPGENLKQNWALK